MCLGPTHEGLMTVFVDSQVNSYKQLPVTAGRLAQLTAERATAARRLDAAPRDYVPRACLTALATWRCSTASSSVPRKRAALSR